MTTVKLIEQYYKDLLQEQVRLNVYDEIILIN